MYLVVGFFIGLLALALAVPMESDGIEERAPRAQVIRSCRKQGEAALTFDDGPSAYVNEANSILKAAGAKGTFFINGNNWECIYSDTNAKRVKFLYDQGHQVASHTWSHKDLTTLTRAQLVSEFQRTDDAIRKITGATPAHVRPPYGKYNNLVLEVAAEMKESIVIWDFDSGDSTGSSVATQKKNYDDLMGRKPSTIVSLAHDVHGSSIREILPYAVQKLQAAGYKLVTVAECLGTFPYQKVESPSARDSSWRC